MGGEPLLNPTVCDYVDGINELWNQRVQIMTNGTRPNRVPGLYERMVRYRQDGDFYRANWYSLAARY
jgi:MoaA/NifB/PqqE/SkfB family radical SAM enzyme